MKHYVDRIALLRHRYINPINSNKNARSLFMVYGLCLDDIAKKCQK